MWIVDSRFVHFLQVINKYADIQDEESQSESESEGETGTADDDAPTTELSDVDGLLSDSETSPKQSEQVSSADEDDNTDDVIKPVHRGKNSRILPEVDDSDGSDVEMDTAPSTAAAAPTHAPEKSIVYCDVDESSDDDNAGDSNSNYRHKPTSPSKRTAMETHGGDVEMLEDGIRNLSPIDADRNVRLPRVVSSAATSEVLSNRSVHDSASHVPADTCDMDVASCSTSPAKERSTKAAGSAHRRIDLIGMSMYDFAWLYMCVCAGVVFF